MNAFEDLLGNHQFTSSKQNNAPKTIGDMKKQQMAEEMDPEKLKVDLFLTGRIHDRCTNWNHYDCLPALFYPGHNIYSKAEKLIVGLCIKEILRLKSKF